MRFEFTIATIVCVCMAAEPATVRFTNGKQGEARVVDTSQIQDTTKNSITLVGKEGTPVIIKKEMITFLVLDGDTIRQDRLRYSDSRIGPTLLGVGIATAAVYSVFVIYAILHFPSIDIGLGSGVDSGWM